MTTLKKKKKIDINETEYINLKVDYLMVNHPQIHDWFLGINCSLIFFLR